jgi:hypothetical protein
MYARCASLANLSCDYLVALQIGQCSQVGNQTVMLDSKLACFLFSGGTSVISKPSSPSCPPNYRLKPNWNGALVLESAAITANGDVVFAVWSAAIGTHTEQTILIGDSDRCPTRKRLEHRCFLTFLVTLAERILVPQPLDQPVPVFGQARPRSHMRAPRNPFNPIKFLQAP